MAAGIIKRLIATAAGISQSVKMWADDTGTLDDNITPVSLQVNSAGTPAAFGSGVNGTDVQRVALATDSPGVTALGQATKSASLPVVIANDQGALGSVIASALPGQEYETVAASATAQALGATGATGDLINGILVIPATTSPGNVLLLDNATSITVFAGGASSVSNLVPFFIPLGIKSVSGAWKITTGANVSCIGVGDFT